jgi:hypothetical protein
MSEPVRLAVEDAGRAFTELLGRNGVSLQAMPFLAVWRCFKEFAETPVDTPSDGLLYEWYITRARRMSSTSTSCGVS